MYFLYQVVTVIPNLLTSIDPQRRYQGKLRIAKSLYQRGYNRQDILELLRLVEWMMTLPKNLELDFQQELIRFE